MLLSVDWDAFSGTRELVFDAPVWGTRDRPEDRLEAWRERARRRGGAKWAAQGWSALAADFPLYPGWEALERYAGLPVHVTLSHADAWGWLEAQPRPGGLPGLDVLNVDSHHDLASLSGDPARVRPGNWAGLGLRAGLIGSYTCAYPDWHAGLPVAEGHDLARTRAELAPLLPPEVLARVTLTRGPLWPDPAQVRGVLLVQSPAWTNPAHDRELRGLTQRVGGVAVVPPLWRDGLH